MIVRESGRDCSVIAYVSEPDRIRSTFGGVDVDMALHEAVEYRKKLGELIDECIERSSASVTE